MTQQEFVKKESEKYKFKLNQTFFADGLTKGLEIMGEYAKWRIKRSDRNHILRNIEMLNEEELKELFLTEKYGNNV